MIRQSRERPSGELELLIRPLNRCHLSSNENDQLENPYDNSFLNPIERSPLEESLEALRDDLTTGQIIEQYEVR